jgi:uncharacterized protein
MSTFVLPIQDIDDSSKRWSFVIEPAWLRAALVDTGLHVADDATNGSLEVDAQRTGNDDILVRSHLRANVLAECARCLGDVPVPVDLDVTSLLLPDSKRPKSTTDDADVEGDELDLEYYSGEKIVLDDIVREHIVLEEPMQPLCREDCPGIPIPEHVRPPADFGEPEETIDPRLSPLMKWKRKLAQNEE